MEEGLRRINSVYFKLRNKNNIAFYSVVWTLGPGAGPGFSLLDFSALKPCTAGAFTPRHRAQRSGGQNTAERDTPGHTQPTCFLVCSVLPARSAGRMQDSQLSAPDSVLGTVRAGLCQDVQQLRARRGRGVPSRFHRGRWEAQAFSLPSGVSGTKVGMAKLHVPGATFKGSNAWTK